jgi:hypothetical protein
MHPNGLREATRRAMEQEAHKQQTRLSPGEKSHRTLQGGHHRGPGFRPCPGVPVAGRPCAPSAGAAGT